MNHTSFQQTRKEAFSLIEIMVTVTLLALIILAMVQAFNVTQKAMVTGLSQVDVLQDGRAASDMMAREIEQAQSLFCFVTNTVTNFWALPPGTFTNRIGSLVIEISNNFIAYSVIPGPNGVGKLFRYDSIHTNELVDGVIDFNATKLDANGNPTTNLPRAVLLELGTLEKRSLEHYNSLSNSSLALSYLTNQAAHLHIFRQRISIKAAQP